MADERYSNNNKGTSPALSHLLNEFTRMPRSSFNMNRRKYFDAFPYAIIPVECFPMLPNSDVDLSYDVSVLTKNPTIRRIMSGCTVELATYRIPHNNDLWEGWNNFITTGRTGKVAKRIPAVLMGSVSGEIIDGSSAVFTNNLPYSPYAYLNIVPAANVGGTSPTDVRKWSIEANSGFQLLQDVQPSGVVSSKVSQNPIDAFIVSALPGVMYTKVAKQYMNPNVLQDNKDWFPENENHDLVLPYDIPTPSPDDIPAVTCASYDNPILMFDRRVHSVSPTNVSASEGTAKDKGSAPWLNVLYYKMRRGNYFNTGSPFPNLIRGDMPTLEVLQNGQLDMSQPESILRRFFDGDYIPFFVNGIPAKFLGHSTHLSQSNSFHNNFVPNVWKDTINGSTAYMFDAFSTSDANHNYPAGSGTPADPATSGIPWSTLLGALQYATVRSISFNLNQWRRLAALTVFRERMARTDGSYNQMIQAQFQYNPRWHEHDVVYCGGSTQPLVFSEVVQTSGDSESSPLGTTGGRAVSAMSNKNIHIHSDDFSMFMTVLTITPDDVYSQGIERLWSELDQSDQYFPIMNNLEPQAILNKELYVSGDSDVDNDVFNYQERYAHWKSRRNQVSGLMALPVSVVGDTGAFIFNRIFGDTPKFNQTFLEGHFTDNENLTFASMAQAQFAVTVVSNMRWTAPIPSVTAPADMGISY